jgi:peroxiredoxin Q/BCP
MTVAVGAEAPDFSLPGIDEHGEAATFTLSAYRGRPVVLVFYPGDDTPVCTRQLNAYTSDIDSFVAVDAQVLALSPQSVDSHVKFAGGQGGFGFPLLADEEKAVGGAYGILGPLGFYRRSVVVVDTEGKVTWVHRSIAGVTFKPSAQLVEAVRAAS